MDISNNASLSEILRVEWPVSHVYPRAAFYNVRKKRDCFSCPRRGIFGAEASLSRLGSNLIGPVCCGTLRLVANRALFVRPAHRVPCAALRCLHLLEGAPPRAAVHRHNTRKHLAAGPQQRQHGPHPHRANAFAAKEVCALRFSVITRLRARKDAGKENVEEGERKREGKGDMNSNQDRQSQTDTHKER